MGPILYFDNGNESVAGFPASTLTMIHAGDQVVTLYFGNAQQHVVVLACADDASDVVARALCAALAPLDKFHQKMVTVADDTLSTYMVSGITGVTSLTADPA